MSDDLDDRKRELRELERQTQMERQKLLIMIMEREDLLEKREMEIIRREKELLVREKKLDETKQRLLDMAKKLKGQ
jgi:hypothetical protein